MQRNRAMPIARLAPSVLTQRHTSRRARGRTTAMQPSPRICITRYWRCRSLANGRCRTRSSPAGSYKCCPPKVGPRGGAPIGALHLINSLMRMLRGAMGTG